MSRGSHARLRSVVAAASTLAVLSSTACAVSSTAELSDEDSVTIAIDSDYNSLDPATMNSASAYSLALALYDPLVVNDGNGGFRAGLASRWKDSPTTARFTLRRGLTCADGSPLTAQKVKRSLDHLADPKTASPNRARTFGDGTVTVSADDRSRTVVVKNSKPFNDTVLGLSSPWAGINCGAGDAQFGPGEAPPGTGGWTLDASESIRRSHYVFNRRGDYRPAPGVSRDRLAKRLVYRVIRDQSTIANELAAGGVDLGNGSLLNAAALSRNASLKKVQLPTFGAQFLYFRQTGSSPYGDSRLRRAIAHALDRKEGASAATATLGEVPPSYLSSDVDCTDGVESDAPAHDPRHAASLMRAAGYRRDASGYWSRGGRRITLRLLADPGTYAAGNEYVQVRLRAFGIDVRLTEQPTPDVLEKMGTGQGWDASLFPYGPPISSPNSASSFLLSDSPSNWAGIKNAAFDKAARSAIAVDRSSPRRCRLWAAGQRSLVRAADIVPVWSADTFWFASTKVDASALRSPSGFSVDPTSIRVAS